MHYCRGYWIRVSNTSLSAKKKGRTTKVVRFFSLPGSPKAGFRVDHGKLKNRASALAFHCCKGPTGEVQGMCKGAKRLRKSLCYPSNPRHFEEKSGHFLPKCADEYSMTQSLASLFGGVWSLDILFFCNTPVSVGRLKKLFLKFVGSCGFYRLTLHIVKVFFASPFLKMW